ncbi:MAG TPA: fatty acid desaturase [Pseudobdellovibrionaceae bacterium]|nr:fatty acid desaturase [Pseudobdellovibrionaceae bacterium]
MLDARIDTPSTLDQNSIADGYYRFVGPHTWQSRIASLGSRIWAIAHPYVVIGVAVYAAEILAQRNFVAVLAAVLLISSRQASLYLAGHEGVHGLLHPQLISPPASQHASPPRRPHGFNDFLARWLCLFPLGISLSRYRMHHQLHHALLGTPGDPDQKLYADYPRLWSRTCAFYVRQWLSGQLMLGFFRYYNELLEPQAWRSWKVGSDHWPLVGFWLVAIATLSLCGWIDMLALYWIMPWILGMPLHHFMGALQHGGIHQHANPNLRARSLDGPSWLLEFFFPLNIRFHAEHHLAPSIPYDQLPRFSRWLHQQKFQRRHQGVLASLRELHRESRVSE